MTPSSYIAVMDPSVCSGCELCIERCQFLALSMEDDVSQVNRDRCVGCGICVTTCPEEAVSMVKRNKNDIPKIPENTEELLKRSKETKRL